MAPPPISRTLAKQRVAAVDAAGGNVAAAAQALRLTRQSLDSSLGSIKRLYGYAPKPRAEAAPTDPIAARVARDDAKRLRERLDDAEKRALAAETLRHKVFGLVGAMPSPPHWNPRPKIGQGEREAIILPISDIHMGEVVDLDQMGGRNSYNMAIAAARLQRYFASVVRLGTTHWTGPPPDAIYIALMGDLITGEIHEELAKTNDLLSIPAVSALSPLIIAGIDLLLRSFPNTPIRVVSLPGNHGRTTKKPEAKGFALNSYDTLVAWSVERWFNAIGEKRVQFSAPASGDALINIHGWNIMFTHGDRIGSRGGAGFIGPAATAARGMQRIIQDYAAEGVVVDKVIIGHFHTPLELEQGFVNPPFIGPSEYSRSGRMRSHPAAQWMLTVSRRRCITRRWLIGVGDPSEGSIYRGREEQPATPAQAKRKAA